MTCDDVRELEGAFAAGALNDESRAAVLAHLESCGQHAELGELRAAALAISLTSDSVEPPARLRERVMASVGRRPHENEPAPRRRAMMPLGIAAAVVALIAVGIVTFVVAGGGDDAPHTREFTTDQGIGVRVEAHFGEPETRLRFDGLAEPPTGEEYVAWVVRGAEWLRIGSFAPDADGAWSGDFAFALEEGDALCLTLSGSETPQLPFGVPLFMEPV